MVIISEPDDSLDINVSPFFCPVCYNCYDETRFIPRRLPCPNFHTVCERCIIHFFRNALCPICRASLEFKSFNVNDNGINRDILDGVKRSLTSIVTLCTASCSNCHVKADERLFKLCTTCIPINSYSLIDEYALCSICAEAYHGSSHILESFIKIKVHKEADSLIKSMNDFKEIKSTLTSSFETIMKYIELSEQLTKQMAITSMKSKSSLTMTKVKKMIVRDCAEMKKSSEILQNEVIQTTIETLQRKTLSQKEDIKNIENLCKVDKHEEAFNAATAKFVTQEYKAISEDRSEISTFKGFLINHIIIPGVILAAYFIRRSI